MENIKITVDGKEYRVPTGTLLSHVLQEGGHAALPCGGKGNCGKCRVTVVGQVSAPSVVEQKFLTADDFQNGVRLACLTYAMGDCAVTTAHATQQSICLDTQLKGEHILANPVFDTYGVAVDIGTTTLAACLYNRQFEKIAEVGIPNPQASWGADVVSRMENALAGHQSDLACAIRTGIDQMLTALATQANLGTEAVDSLVITGNTVMLHLLTDTSPEPLTHAPFEAKRLFGQWLSAKEIGFEALSPTARVYLMPCISAFVGGDLVAALLACDFCHGDDTKLLVDIGTNGEMALWHNQQLYVCSTAAGPAFEGAGISMGMAGGRGAIDHVTLCNGQLMPHVLGDETPVGICGSGIVDAVACMLEIECLDETGYLDDDPTELADPVVLTQADIRAVQLAKSAICAGLMTLMHTAHLSVKDIKTLYVAGGFGSYLNVTNAGKIGLIPNELASKVEVLGNAALAGASMLLLDDKAVAKAEEMRPFAQGVELATNPYFTECFMQGMMFE